VPGSALAANVTNGNFETGTLAGWTTNTLGNGAWVADSGTTAPLSGRPISAPPEGNFAAISDQNGPGSHVLYQDVALSAGELHTLSLMTYYKNDSGSFITPNSLEINVSNQQYRIDVMKPTAPTRSVAADDVLATVFRTEVGAPNQRSPFSVSYDLTPFAGQTVRLRFAAVETQFFFRAGIDDVKVVTTSRDADGDGVLDAADNCQFVSNADQADNDGDSQGDVCDADDDNDGVSDAQPDNCQFVANPDQKDVDGDGKGTACDAVELPTIKDQCKNGGFGEFKDGAARFKNQGDCVSFVASGGKNLPAGGV